MTGSGTDPGVLKLGADGRAKEPAWAGSESTKGFEEKEEGENGD
jgi:hypothetical protein